jgi:hypothetical protein
MTGVIVPILLAIVKPMVAREAESRELRRIRQHAQLRNLLPDDGDAAKEMDLLLKVEVAKLSSRTRSVLNRKVNKSNLAAIMLVSFVGGCISYVLAWLAQTNLWGWSIFFWILFIIWILIVFIFVFFGGLPNFYTHNDKNSKE